jgi:FdrA protein
MAFTRFEIRSSAYYDSVVLMQLQRALVDLPGVQDAGVVMATPTNRDLLAEAGLLPDSIQEASADDLLIVVRAASEEEAAAALARVDELLARRRAAVESEFRPRSLDAAAGMLPHAGWVLVSVPGKYAAEVARRALEIERHVFLYSDNVPLEAEASVKQFAREKGRLLMGPDCGTAIINGVGLGFANRVRWGKIGLIGASGTGLQAVVSHIHALGGGVSHAIGTGGRDLKDPIGGITSLQALDLLGRDPDTRVIVLVSKPPGAATAPRVLAAAQALGKPVVVYFSGYPPPAARLGNLYFALNSMEAAKLAVALLQEGLPVTRGQPAPGVNGYLRGLFSGGTLAQEALLGLQPVLFPLFSNLAAEGVRQLPEPARSESHTILDLGADEFTVGRLHPMIDNDLRLRRLAQEAADLEVGLILLDVVLGDGAHPDPASELAPALREVRRQRAIEVVAILIGTDEDPQDFASQERQLSEAGAVVLHSVADAVAHINARMGHTLQQDFPPVPLAVLQTPLAAINVGLESFYVSLLEQGAEAIQVDWRPPAGGKEDLIAILARLKVQRAPQGDGSRQHQGP